MATETTKLPFVEGSAPATPAASRVVIYAKSDGLMYSKDDAGAETVMSGGGSSDLDAIIAASSGQDIADALAGAAAPDAGNVFATIADITGGGAGPIVLDTFNRANGAVGHASGAGQGLWFIQSGTWAIDTNTLTETGGGSERFIFIHSGTPRGKRTLTWVLNNKGSGGDGGLVWRAWPVASGNTPNAAMLLNIEATYKLYIINAGASYSPVSIASGSAATPANGDSIVVTDDGYEISVVVNGGSAVTYLSLNPLTVVPQAQGAFVGFRAASSTGIKHDSLTVVDE